MRGLHLSVGIFSVIVFRLTGQILRRHQPPLGMLSDAARLMLRSRHIYILASGLVNLLILAFLVEPEKGFQPEMWRSAAGLYALFGGSMAHLASSFGRPRDSSR